MLTWKDNLAKQIVPDLAREVDLWRPERGPSMHWYAGGEVFAKCGICSPA